MQHDLALPSSDTDLPLHRPAIWSSCGNCDQPVHNDDVVIRQYHTGHMIDVEHWCSLGCYHEWFVNRLRQWGL